MGFVFGILGLISAMNWRNWGSFVVLDPEMGLWLVVIVCFWIWQVC
ncbi:unnamed protein product, partial [Linum tenue]